jgi:hypothetical protein
MFASMIRKQSCFLICLILALTACVKRQTVLVPSGNSVPPISGGKPIAAIRPTEVIPMTRQRSVVFDKPVTSISFYAPSEISPVKTSTVFEWWKAPDEDDPIYKDVNRFFSQNYAIKTQRLTGGDHFLNWLWENGKYVLCGVGVVGFLTADHVVK